MMKTTATLILLILTQTLWASDSLRVREIEINGLVRTHRWVVERELHFAVGDTIRRQDVELAAKRLRNRIIFNYVQASADSSGHVVFDIREAWPILPLVQVELTEGTLSEIIKQPSTILDKATIYAGAGDLNFHGDGAMLLGFGQFGASDGYSARYASRWLSPTLPLSLDVLTGNLRISDREWAVRDSSARMRSVLYQTNVATRYGAPTRIGLSASYQGMKKENPFPRDRSHWSTWWISPYVILDHRDLEWYPTRGAFMRTSVDLVGGDARFTRSQCDLRGFFPLTKADRPPVLALHLYGATSSDGMPGWAGYFTGFGTILRGYTGVKSLSQGYLLGDAEFRFPITRETTYNVPFIGSYGERWPFGIHGVVFAESAELQYGGMRDIRSAAGFGLHVRVPYVQIIEISFAVNRDGDHEMAAASGVRF